MAEAIFRKLIQDENLTEKISVDSAGTGHWHIGKPPHDGTISILNQNGINASGLKARQLVRNDLETFDYIIALDREILKDINKLMRASEHKPEILLLLSLIDTYTTDVPDPYYTDNFEEVYDLLYNGNKALLVKLKTEL